jgi:2'-5' RNA ligase
MSSVRLFFALWPDAARQAELAEQVSATVHQLDAAARPIPAANYHLTLAFLGSVPAIRFGELGEIATRCAQASTAIDVRLDAVEHWRRSQILCVTARETPPAATTLVEQLGQALCEAGFTPDFKHPFRPHVTLARKATRPIHAAPLLPSVWHFSEISLVQSRPEPSGSVYSVLASYPLRECAPAGLVTGTARKDPLASR